MSYPVAPMLAVKANLDKIKYPVIVQPKYDGIRCQIHNGTAFSRTHLPIPNLHIQEFVQANQWLNGLDGEWIVGDPQDKDVYNQTQSFVMTIHTDEFHPEATFYAFDLHDRPEMPYRARAEHVELHVADYAHPRVKSCPRLTVEHREALDDAVAICLTSGYEGAMIRGLDSLYKPGRATVKQGQLLKVKPWEDMEGIIKGFEPLRKNLNEAHADNFGRVKRSSHQENKVAIDTLGAFVLTIIWNGEETELSVGTGLTQEQRKSFWDNREALLGKMVKFKYIPFGSKDAPRHPSFVGFRHEADL